MNIDRIPLPTKKVFNQNYAASKPVIFTNAMEDWQALHTWTPSYFKENFGDMEALVQVKEEITGTDYGPVSTDHISMPLAEYIDKITNDPTYTGYLAQYPLFIRKPELLGHFRFPDLYWMKPFTQIEFYLAPGNSKSKLHFDAMDNFFTQIYGRKKIVLISPKFSESCYPVNVTWDDGYSKIDVENPDYDTYPQFKEVERIETVLEPGEMLYIPTQWWHDIRSQGISINVNMWWYTPTCLKRILFPMLKLILARNWQMPGSLRYKSYKSKVAKT